MTFRFLLMVEKKNQHPVSIRRIHLGRIETPPKNEKLGAIGQKLTKLKATYYYCYYNTAAAGCCCYAVGKIIQS